MEQSKVTFQYVLLILLISGCGSDTNLFKYVTSDSEKNSFDALVSSGQAAYDRNDLILALEFASQAFELNPRSERAALLFGYVNLSLAKADPFSLASSLSDIESEEENAEGPGEGPIEESSEEVGTSDDEGTGETLGKLKGALGLTDEDILILGELDSEDPDVPILLPKCVEEVRDLLATLTFVDQAIRAVCPFVDDAVRNVEDVRQDCESTEADRKFIYKSHFLWAFAHLTEALAFHSVLTYGNADPSGKKSNLQVRVEKLKGQEFSDPSQIAAFASALESLERTVSAVLPVGGACSLEYPTSQLSQTLNDLLAVNIAFAQIPQIPEKIKGSITKAIDKLTNLQGTSTDDDPRLAQTKALKGDLTKKLAGPLAQKLDSLEQETGQPVSEEDAAKICASFDSIAVGGDQTPALCKTSP